MERGDRDGTILAVGLTILRAWLVATLIVGPVFWTRAASAAEPASADGTPSAEEAMRRQIQADSAAAAAHEQQQIDAERRQNSAAALKSARDLYQEKEYGAAAERLEAVIASDPNNPEALLLAGLAHLRLDDPASAGARWEKFTVVSKDPKLARQVGRYNTIVLHEANLRFAKEAVAREHELSSQPTSPRTVAVAPFRNAGSAEYAPLGKALASMLIDNLTLLPGVQVLEREYVNALIEEAKLAGTGLVEKSAAVRAGKLLRAGRVIAGSHADWTASPTHLSLDVLLVYVDTGTTIASARTEALATEFYSLVPGVAEQFASSLGQPLESLPSEVRQKIDQIHTRSIKAELAFGQALDALDRKDVAGARKACKELAAEDSDFPLAKRKCDRIPLEWLALSSVATAVEALALTMAAATVAGAGLSTTVVALSAAGVAAAAGAGVAVSQSGGGGGGSGSSSNQPVSLGGNNPPALQGVSDRSVPAGGTAAIDMECFDPDSTATTIQNTSAGPNSSFNQTSGNPASGHYRQVTNTSETGQVFNVTFVCTDNGNPPASDTKTARITVLPPTATMPTVVPTAVGCQPLAAACATDPQCCSGSCGETNVSANLACCVPLQGACQSANGCCRPSGVTMGCGNGRCCLGPGSPCPVAGPDPSCCNGTCGPFGCDTQVPLPTPTPTTVPVSTPTPTVVVPPTPSPSPTSTPSPLPTPLPTCIPNGISGCSTGTDCCIGICCVGGICGCSGGGCCPCGC